MEFGPTEITDKKGERFTLRSLQSCDTARLVRFQEQASRESEFLPWAPGGSNLMPDTAQYYIAQFADAEREMLLGIFAGDCKLVGLAELAGVGSGPYRWHRCTIAPGLLKRYWGRGLGTTLFTTNAASGLAGVTITAPASGIELGYEDEQLKHLLYYLAELLLLMLEQYEKEAELLGH